MNKCRFVRTTFFLVVSFYAILKGQFILPLNFSLHEVLTVPVDSAGSLISNQDIATLSDGSFLVSDRLDYKLKKFDRKGRFVRNVGRRGSGNAEFRGPGPLAATGTLIAVADHASSRIQFFSSDLVFRSSFHSIGPVFDLAFDGEGNLWAGILTGREDQNLVRMGPDGEVSKRLHLKNCTKNPFDRIFWFLIDRSGDIVIAYVFNNKIEVWDRNGNYRNEFEVPGLPVRSKRSRISKRIFSSAEEEIPEGNIFWSIAGDSKGRIFLLADEQTPNPRRDVYIVTKEGELLSIVTLPREARNLTIDSQDRLLVSDAVKPVARLYRLVEAPRKAR